MHRDPGADHDKHGRIDVGAAQRPKQSQFDRRAKQPSGHHGERKCDKEIDAELMHHDEHDVGAERIQHPMREVHDVHDAEDQGETDAQQRIGATEHQHVDQMLQKLAQGGSQIS